MGNFEAVLLACFVSLSLSGRLRWGPGSVTFTPLWAVGLVWLMNKGLEAGKEALARGAVTPVPAAGGEEKRQANAAGVGTGGSPHNNGVEGVGATG